MGVVIKAKERHQNQNKMFVRDRVEAICDHVEPFLETGLLAAHFDVYRKNLFQVLVLSLELEK